MIVVFGSLNVDIVLDVPALPRPGQTVLCPGYRQSPGGKGANQAVAAARALGPGGGRVAMVGRIGADALGGGLREGLAREGIDVSGVTAGAHPTGCAVICVDPFGQNQIAVAAGANLDATADQVPDAALKGGTVVVLQMEVRPEENWRLVERAKARGARVVLNAAPAGPVPEAVLAALDVLIVNEGEAVEAAASAGIPDVAPVKAAAALARRFGLVGVVTLGGDGALACTSSETWTVPSLPITPVDTVGAGDAFVGAFAAALDGGEDVPEALRRASVAGALTCLAQGAQTSPPRAEIDRRLADLPAARRM